MRIAIVGGYFHDNPKVVEAFVRAATEITHTDPKALIGALAIARLVAWAVELDATQRPSIEDMRDVLLQSATSDAQWSILVSEVQAACTAGLTVSQFAAKLGLNNGVTGYVYHTVPVVTYAWWRHFGDFRGTVEAVLECGGDSDTTGMLRALVRNRAERAATGVNVDHTGSAGLAGLMKALALDSRLAPERIAVVFSGVSRTT